MFYILFYILNQPHYVWISESIREKKNIKENNFLIFDFTIKNMKNY